MESKLAVQWLRQGQEFVLQHSYLDALEAFEHANSADPSNVDAYNEKGKLLDRLGRYEEAIEATNHAISLAPDGAKFYANKALFLFKMDRYTEALTVFDQAIERDSSMGRAYHYKGHILLLLKRPAESLTAYEAAVRLDPDSAEVLNGYGNVLRELKRFSEALTAYDQALQLDPGDIHNYNGKGSLLYYLDRYQEALEIVEKALALTPLLAETFNRKGLVLLKLERYEEAIAVYDQALQVDPDYIYSYNGKGFSLHKLGRDEEALAVYDAGIACNATFPLIWTNRGDSLNQLGQKTEARKSRIQAHILHNRQLKARETDGIVSSRTTSSSGKAPTINNDKPADTIQFDWERIESWLSRYAPHAWHQLRPGASELEIQQAETALGLVLPEDFKASHRLHDGGYMIDLVTEMNIFPLAHIVDDWRIFRDIEERGIWIDAGIPYYFQKDRFDWQTGPIQPLWWHQHWIPIGRDQAGNHCCLDFAPATGGSIGQVIDRDHEAGPSRVLASRFSEILSTYAQDLEAGKYVDTVYGLQTRSND